MCKNCVGESPTNSTCNTVSFFSSGNTERSKIGSGDVESFGGHVELGLTFHEVHRSPGRVLE